MWVWNLLWVPGYKDISDIEIDLPFLGRRQEDSKHYIHRRGSSIKWFSINAVSIMYNKIYDIFQNHKDPALIFYFTKEEKMDSFIRVSHNKLTENKE